MPIQWDVSERTVMSDGLFPVVNQGLAITQ